MRKILLSYHGLGDNILLTPVLRKYKELYPDISLGMTRLRRLPVPALMEECPYVDQWLEISDPWNDYPTFEEGYEAILNDTKGYAVQFGYEEIIPLTMSPNLGITHKIYRAAKELGIEVDDFRTEIFPKITEEIKEEADKFLAKVQEPYVFVHFKTGNPPKDISKAAAVQFLYGVSPFQIIEYGTRTLPSNCLQLGNIPLEMEILSRCSKVICADSFIMHAAGALGIPTVAVFVHTPPEWVMPLHDTPMEIYVRA